MTILPLRCLPLLGFITALLFLNTTDATAQKPENSAANPSDARLKQENWKKQHESFVARAKKGDVDVLFIGDSITAGWNGNGKKAWKNFDTWKPANFGIGGDKTQDVLWRITEGKELNGIDPKVVVVMIGTNNTGNGGNTAEEIAAGVKAIVAEFQKQKPKAKILLLGVFPRSGKKPVNPMVVTASELQPKIKAINDIIAKLDDGKSVKYLDIGNKFLDEKGDLQKMVMPDFLHLSPEAYETWAAAIKEPVESLIKEAK